MRGLKNLISMNSIRNMNSPVCSSCRFYKPQTHLDYDSDINRCSKFGYKDIYTGKIYHEYVSSCRQDELKCGLEGKEYIENPNSGTNRILHNCFPKHYIGLSILIILWLASKYAVVQVQL